MKNFEAFLDKIYSQPLSERQHWYAEATAAYAQYRAPYLPEVIDRVCGQITPKSHILEIGSGPGNATEHFLQRGFTMTCLEPNQKACEYMAKRFRNYPNIRIINSTFEEWDTEAPAAKFNMVLAGTSFHWLLPDTRCQRLASRLKPTGKIVLLWTTAPQPGPDIFRYILPLYEQFIPSFANFNFENLEIQAERLDSIGQSLIESGYFVDLQLEHLVATIDATPQEYLGLLTTLSPYIALAETAREQLIKTLNDVFESRQIYAMKMQYLCAAHIAQMNQTNGALV